MLRAVVLAAMSVAIMLCTGCASIVSGTNQSLSVTTSSNGTDVEGAKCQLDNDKGSWFVTTPGSVTVRRSFKDLRVSCTLQDHEPAQQQAKSATKGMVAGNALIGGVIGIGVDMSTGAAYDYPNVIVVGMIRSAGAGGAAAAAVPTVGAPPLAPPRAVLAVVNPASPFRAGTRLIFADLDVYSGAPLGETTLVLSEVSATQWVFNDGSIVTALDGAPLKGSAHAVMLYGLGPRELARGGTMAGHVHVGGLTDDATVTINVLRKQTKVISGQRFDGTRVHFEGYATRAGLTGGGPSNGAFFEGEALIDNATGIVLELNVQSRSTLYLVRRELVHVIASS